VTSERSELIGRIWERDPTVWTGADEAKWLGWLDEPRRMAERVAELNAFADSVAEENLDAVVLLGMGGSSLAPEVLRRTFGVESFHVLDTTHPEAIRNLERSIDLDRTLFVSASKSGGTLETRSHTDYFWEKTGKPGTGLVPAPGESPDGPDRQAAEPQIADPYALGGEFFRWEFAVAVAGAFLEINPFDQPDVQAAKDKTNEVLATGKEPDVEPEGSVDELLAQAHERDYVCVQAFIEPSEENDHRIADLVRKLRRRTGLVVTHGYGPRYLHSTGQLHKGGPNTGLFLQVVDDPGDELKIPGRPFGFRRLIRAQAAGDYASLKERGRRVARVHLQEI
jgi:hypothetical protein